MVIFRVWKLLRVHKDSTKSHLAFETTRTMAEFSSLGLKPTIFTFPTIPLAMGSLTLPQPSSLCLGPAGCFCHFLWGLEVCGHTCPSPDPAPRRKKRWRCRFSPHAQSPSVGLGLRASVSWWWTGQARCPGCRRGAGGSQNCTRCGNQHLCVYTHTPNTRGDSFCHSLTESKQHLSKWKHLLLV